MHAAILIAAGAVGAAATFLLQRYGVSAVVASCLVGLLGAGFGYFISDADVPAVIFAGSFAGMTALTVTTLPLVTLAGAGAGGLYVLMTLFNVFPGFGGRLGTIGFIAILLVAWLVAIFFKK